MPVAQSFASIRDRLTSTTILSRAYVGKGTMNCGIMNEHPAKMVTESEIPLGSKGNRHVSRTGWYPITFDVAPTAVAVAAFVVFSPCLFFGG